MVRNAPLHRKPNVFSVTCPSRRVLTLVANKWVALVVFALADGAQRYSELQRRIVGVSQKMLTQTLRELERAGVVARKVYPVVPPKVEYTLTPLGESLREPLEAICTWAEAHWRIDPDARTRRLVRKLDGERASRR